MDIVVNASPLILLCKAGHIRLPEKLGRNVYVPRSVLNEVAAYPEDEAVRYRCSTGFSQTLRAYSGG